jgi:DNA repair protein SbcC/Rad50
MIPIRLTFQGLYSYQEKQIIDFTRMTAAHLFGIFGPVGSGKSAILEAITYALYGKTDRLNQSGDNRYYNMMNLKSNELTIEFIFTAGKSDTEYLALIKSRRNSRQFDDVKAIDRTAYQKVDNAWIPMEVSSLETVIGLSYENFKRTIIIPQGKFQEFLQLGNKERTQMMKELFNLEKYELYFKVVTLETKNNQQIENLDGQLKQLGNIQVEQIREAEATFSALKKEIEQKAGKVAEQRTRKEEMRKLKEVVIRIQLTERTLGELKAREPEFDRLDQKITDYEFCRLHFKNLLETADEISSKITHLKQQIDDDNSQLLITGRKLSENKSDFDRVKKEFEGREIYNQQAGELVKVIKLLELKVTGNRVTENIKQADQSLTDTENRIKKIKSMQEEMDTSIRSLKERYPDMSVLSKAREWHAVNKMLVAAGDDLLHEIEGISRDLAVIRSSAVFAGIPADLGFRDTNILLEEKIMEINQSRDSLNFQAEHLSLQARLKEYANNLEDGKPCPLCGSLSHPRPLNSLDVTETLAQIKNQILEKEDHITAIRQQQKKIGEIESTILSKKEFLHGILQKQKEHLEKIRAHSGLFDWEAYRDESKVTRAFALADQISAEISNLDDRKIKLSKSLEQENQLKESYQRASDEHRHRMTAVSTESAALMNQLVLIKMEDFDSRPVEEILQFKETLLKKYHGIGNLYHTIMESLSALQTEHDRISGRLQANNKALSEEIFSQHSSHHRIEEQLKNSAFSTVVEVKNILAGIVDVESDRKKMTEFRSQLSFAEKQLGDLRSEKGERVYDEELHIRLIEWLEQAAEELRTSDQHLGKLQGELNKMKADLVTYEDMHSRMESLQSRAEDIRVLKQLFKASGFVNYISTVYLQELSHAANERFYKLTRQKLSLEVTEDNNFQIRDFLNGGKVRNIKTLSGGQTFQAALSLSLALADSIQKITESNQNFFFLDEGFGSLDKDSLSIVFETLKSLRRENRIVGVISHVEEMQQEIDNYLSISMDEERGSVIRCSWD